MSYSTAVRQEYLPSWEAPKNGFLPEGAVPGGNTRNGMCFIARAKDINDKWVPAVIIPEEKKCISIARDNRFSAFRDLQILCHCKPKWVNVVVNVLPLPMKSLPVFQSNKSDNRKSFFGRVTFDEHVTFGEVSIDDEFCYLFKKSTNQWEPYDRYEVLTLSQIELEELKRQDNPGIFSNLPWPLNSNSKPALTVTVAANEKKKKGAKGKEDYTWRKGANGSVPQGALIACRSNNMGDIYVGRCSYKGEVLLGKFIPKLRCCIVGYEGEEVKINNYEVLCDAKAEWIPMNAGQRNVPDKAILGGRTKNSEALYIGRVLDKSSVGKVLQGACFVVYGNKEHEHRKFEILATSSNPTEMKPYSGYAPQNSSVMNRSATDDQHNLMKMTRGQHASSSKRETYSDEEYDFPQIPQKTNDHKANNYFSEQQNTRHRIRDQSKVTEQAHKPLSKSVSTSGQYLHERKEPPSYSSNVEPQSAIAIGNNYSRQPYQEQTQTMISSTTGITSPHSQYGYTSQTAQYMHERKETSYSSNVEPQCAIALGKNYSNQPYQEQTQPMISSTSGITSSQASLEVIESFGVNSQLHPQQRLNEYASSEYKQSHPVVYERSSPSGQGALEPPSTEYSEKLNETVNSSIVKSYDNNWELARVGQNISQSSLQAGHDFSGRPIYIARSKHDLCLLVTGLTNVEQKLTTYYNKRIYHSSEYEVFCNKNVSWQKMHEGERIPNNAIHCGYTDEDQNIFAGRVRFQHNALLIAPVYERSPKCCLFIDNQEVPFSMFEIMISTEKSVEAVQNPPIEVDTAYQHADVQASSQINSVTRNLEELAISQASQPSSNNTLNSSGTGTTILGPVLVVDTSKQASQNKQIY